MCQLLEQLPRHKQTRVYFTFTFIIITLNYVEEHLYFLHCYVALDVLVHEASRKLGLRSNFDCRTRGRRRGICFVFTFRISNDDCFDGQTTIECNPLQGGTPAPAGCHSPDITRLCRGMSLTKRMKEVVTQHINSDVVMTHHIFVTNRSCHFT